jgi:hypothetical protein
MLHTKASAPKLSCDGFQRRAGPGLSTTGPITVLLDALEFAVEPGGLTPQEQTAPIPCKSHQVVRCDAVVSMWPPAKFPRPLEKASNVELSDDSMRRCELLKPLGFQSRVTTILIQCDERSIGKALSALEVVARDEGAVG